MLLDTVFMCGNSSFRRSKIIVWSISLQMTSNFSVPIHKYIDTGSTQLTIIVTIV